MAHDAATAEHLERPSTAEQQRARDARAADARHPLSSLALAGILAVALLLRLWRLDLTVYEVDEAAILRLAEDLVRLGRVPLSGPVFSAGIPSAPHFIYLVAPVVALSRDPAFVSGAVAVANLLGLLATVWLAWRAFGRSAALFAGALYAANPYAVFYARRIWQPDLLPPLAALFFVTLDLGVLERRAWWAAASLGVAALSVLVHPSFAPLLVLAVLPLAVLVTRRHWRPLLVGVCASALLGAPTLVHEIQTHWVDIPNLRYYASLHTWLDFDAVRYAVALATGWAAPVDPAVPPLGSTLPAQIVAGLELALLASSVGLAIVYAVRERGRARLCLAGMLAWLCWPVVSAIRHTLPLQAHYFLATTPAVFLLLGFGCAWLWRHGPVLRAACLIAVAVVIASQVVEDVGGLSYVDRTHTQCYGPPLSDARSVEQAVVAFGANAGHAAVELPADDSLALGYLLRNDFGALDVAGNASFGLGRALGPGAPGGSPPRLLEEVESGAVQYPDGIQLTRVGLADRVGGDQRFAFALDWQVDGAAASIHPHAWRVTLLDSAGQTVFEQTGVDHVPASLQAQRIVSWFTVDPAQNEQRVLPSGSYEVQVRLVDTWVPATLGDPLNIGPMAIGAPRRCMPPSGG